MKKVVLIIFLISFGLSGITKPKMTPLVPYKPYNPYNTTTPNNTNYLSQYPKIDKAEKKLFGKIFRNEDITSRLSRLESKLFQTNYHYLSLAERTENISQKIGFNEYATISQNELAQMEQRIFMKIYPHDNTQMRITRLEKEIFGAMQGGDLDERFETLQSATQYYNAFPSNNLSNQIPYYSNPYYESFQQPKITLPSIFKSIGSFFSQPTITGYSPNIIYPNNVPYNSYDNLYTGSRGINRNISRPGFHYDQLQHFNQGSTVNILQD